MTKKNEVVNSAVIEENEVIEETASNSVATDEKVGSRISLPKFLDNTLSTWGEILGLDKGEVIELLVKTALDCQPDMLKHQAVLAIQRNAERRVASINELITS